MILLCGFIGLSVQTTTFPRMTSLPVSQFFPATKGAKKTEVYQLRRLSGRNRGHAAFSKIADDAQSEIVSKMDCLKNRENKAGLADSDGTGQGCVPASPTGEQTTNPSVVEVSHAASCITDNKLTFSRLFLLSSFLLPATGRVVHRPCCQQSPTRAWSPSPRRPPRHTVIATQPRQHPVLTLQPPTGAATAGQPARLSAAAWSTRRRRRPGVLGPPPVPHRPGRCFFCVARTRTLGPTCTTAMCHLSAVRHHMLSEHRWGAARGAKGERTLGRLFLDPK